MERVLGKLMRFEESIERNVVRLACFLMNCNDMKTSPGDRAEIIKVSQGVSWPGHESAKRPTEPKNIPFQR